MIATPADSELIFRPEVRLYLYRAAAILSRLRGRGPPSGGGGGCRLRDLRHNPGGPLLHVRDGETQDKDTFVGEKPSCSALIRVMLFVMAGARWVVPEDAALAQMPGWSAAV